MSNKNNYSVLPSSSLPASIKVSDLSSLANFLEEQTPSPSSLALSYLPKVLQSGISIYLETKKMKQDQKRFEKKIQFLSNVAEKDYELKKQAIKNQTELQLKSIEHYTNLELAKIKANTSREILEINRHYDIETQKLYELYDFKREELRVHYNELRRIQRSQDRKFEQMMRLAREDRKERKAILDELKSLCDLYNKKIAKGTATSEEISMYMGFINLRINCLNNSEYSVATVLASMLKG